MTQENNVKKSTKLNKKEQPKTQSANAVKQKKPKKVRLHSKLKVNVPLTQSLMLILPSLAKHASAETVSPTDDSTLAHQEPINDQKSTVHSSIDISKDENQKPITRNIHDSDAIVGQESSSTGGEMTLRPSHHLSSSSHPQAHYIPASSIPSIESGGLTAPTNNVPTTPSLPVTFTPEVIKGIYGELHVDSGGKYTFVLNPLSPQYVLLHQNQPGTDKFVLHLSNGSSVVVQIPVTGKQDVPTISGDLHGIVTEDSNVDSHGLLNAAGKIDVVDPDHDQSSVLAETITGKYGTLTIDSNGAWHYQVDNSLPNIQALTSLTSLHESFTIHTKDGTPQALEMTIGGIDDNAVVTGVDADTVTEDLTTQVQGQLSVTDSDLGEAHFQASQVTSNFGTLSITKDGAWTYNLDNNNPVVQGLGRGSTATDIVTVHSADGTSHQVTVTINGTNDNAVITSSTANSPSSFFAIGKSNGSSQVTEDKDLTVSGQLNITDIDSKEAHFSNSDLKGTLGTLHLKDNGDWTYDLDNKNPQVQALGKGSATTDIITIHSADGTPHQIAITVNGTNDKAVISGTSAGVVTEESQLHTSGTLTVTDVDTGEAHFSNADIVGSLGTLHLTDSGSWTYALDNTNPTVQALGKGATATDVITVHSVDGTPHHVTITVNGTNDKAVIAGTDSGAVTEESQLHTSGTLTVIDVDTGEAHFSNTNIIGLFGTLHLTDSGKWTYDLDNTNSTVQALGKGATSTDTITVHSADGTPHQVTITINGTNDKAVIGGTNTGAVAEESQLHTSGTLTVTDVDKGEAHFSNTDIAGALGTLHLTDSGKWTYDLDNKNPQVQSLGKGSATTDIITIHSADGTPHQIAITVNGTNDKAVISGTSAGVVTEESQLHTSGTLTVTDVDTGEAHFSNTDITGSLGTLHLTDSGSWTYDLDNTNPTVQALGKGATTSDTITVHSADGTAHQVTITVNGTNDKAIIGGSNTVTVTVTEESQLHTSRTLTVTDVDTGEAHFSNTDIVGSLGTLHLTDSGSWTYDLDNTNPTVQALGQGATATETITVQSVDGTTHQVTITVNGTNDIPVIKPVATQTVTEDGSKTITFHATDVDTTDTLTPSVSATHGTAALNTQGEIVFTPDANYNGPATVVLSVTDGHTTTSQTINVGVTPANDAPVITPIPQISATEDGSVVTGKIASTDIDTGDTASFKTTFTQGGFTLNTDGSYKLDPTDASFQHLKAGEIETLTIPVTVTDSAGATDTKYLVITITGTNDAPTISGIDTGTLKEDIGANPQSHNLTATGKLDIVDIDTGESSFVGHGFNKTGLQGHYGHLQISPDGGWSYFADNSQSAIQTLGKGEHLTDTIQVTSKDGTTHDIVITINGSNDAPVITPVATQTVSEDGSKTITFHATDVDTTDTLTPSVSATHGTAALNTQGEIVFTPDANYNGPATVVLSVTDGHTTTSQTINVGVTPANDAPVITPIPPISATEDGSVVTGKIASTDLDTGDTASFKTTFTQGGFTLNADGSYELDPTDASFQHLKAGEIETLTIPVTVTDSAGATDTKDLVITITGTNDVPTISGIDTGTLKEDVSANPQSHNLTATGKLDIVDIDTGESSFVGHGFNKTGLQGHYGHLQISPDGSWSYFADNSQSAIQTLGNNEHLTDTITVTSKDGTTHDIVITINGTNDAPTVSHTVSLPSGNEDQSINITVHQFLANATDIDSNDLGQLSVDNLQVDHGSISQNTDGSFTFTPTPNYNGPVHFNYDVKDAHGGVTHTGANMTLSSQQDVATFSGVDTGDVHEGHTYTAPDGHMTGGSVDDRSPDHMHGNIGKLSNDLIHTEGQLIITDADKGESHVATGTYQGHYGHIIMLPSGEWNYYASIGQNSTGREIDHLGQGEVLTDTVAIKSADGTRHDINITIHGDNDRPYCSAEVTLVNGEEDKAIVLTSAQLLQNTVDVDANDAGKLSIDNLQATHGAITVNPDGTFTFTPEKDYNGDVHFDYDVKDAHGGITHTGASVVLSSVADSAIITGQDTGAVDEGHGHYFDMSPDYGKSQLTSEALYADGKLDITDPDLGESKFDDHGGGYSYSGQYGRINLHEDGTWHYMVDIGHNGFTTGTSTTNAGTTIDKLGDGDSLTDTITVYSKDGTAHDIVVTIHGDNDAPYCSSEVQLNSGKEDIAQVLTLNQLLQNTVDVDANDAGQLTIENLHADHGSIAINADGTFTFTPAKDYNGSVHFNYDVKDAHGGVTHTGANIDLAAVDDAAIITGQSTGDVDEGYGTFGDRSPDYAQTGMAKIGQDVLSADGKLDIVDPDTGESKFDPKGRGWNNSYHGQYGHLLLNTDGTWHYIVPVGSVNWVSNRKTTIGTTIDKLGEGQTLTDTITIQSKDGTTHDIVITIHGDNDKPYCSSEVQLNSGKEDTAQVLTLNQLLQNTVDVDANDAGKLTIENLHADHGSILDNKDGTFTFTPAKDYNGDVHFNYDVKDTHGGVTHTGANMTLASQQDAATFSGVDTGNITEDKHVGHSSAQTIAVSGSLTVTDPDAGQDHFQFTQFGEQAIHDPFNGSLHITPQGNWGYSVKNSALQYLHEGDVENVVYRVYSADGTSHDITITVTGTNDAPVLAAQTQSVIEDGSALQGQMQATDVDYNSNTILSYEIANPVDGLTFNANGSYTFDPTHASYQHLGAGQEQTITIPVTVKDEANTTSTQNLTITVHGTNDAPTLAVTNLAANEDGLSVKGTALFTDVDATDTHAFTVSSMPSGEGSVSIDATTGEYTFTPGSDFQLLAEGATKDVTFNVTVTDGHGGTATQTVTVMVTGTNDNPVLGVTQTTHSTGTLTETDTDTIDTHTFSVVQGAGQFGSLSVNPQTGAYTYSPSGSVQGMHYDAQQGRYAGDDTFEIKVVDNHGAESSQFITFGAQGVVSAPTGTTTTPTVTASVPLPATIATTAPATATNPAVSNVVTLDLANSSDTGDSQTDNLTKDTTPTIDGHTYIPFSQVTIYDGAQNAIGHGTSDASGGFSITVSAIGDGVHHLTASALDPSAAASTVSSVLDMTVDTKADIRVNMVQTPNGDHIDSIQLYMGQDVTPTSIQLVDEHGNRVTVDTTVHMTPQASASHPDHNYVTYNNIDVSTLSGTVHVEVEGTDTAGNVAQDSGASHTVEVLSAIGVSLTNDTGTNTSDHITSDGSLSVSGQDHGTSLQYSIDGGHHWLSSFTPSQGLNTVEVRQISPTGSTSTSASLTFTLDNQALAPTVSLVSDTGSSQTDLLTNNGALTVSGTEANALVEYSIDNGQHWSSNFTPVEGINNVQVRQTDFAGNVSPSSTISFTLDTQADISVNVVRTPAGNTIDMLELYGAKDVEITSLTIVDEHGTRLLIDPSSRSMVSASSRHPDHQYTSFKDVDVSTLSGRLHVEVDGVDAAGNIVQDHSGAYSVDKAPITRPTVPVVQQQHVTGGTGVTIHSTDTHGGFALNQYGGADIRSPYGTAHIDEYSGHVSFRPIGTGNPHTAHHGHFEIFQHGQHVADVDVTSYNHNHQPSQITVTPVGPPPPPPTPGTVQHDEPDPFADSEVMITESDNSHLDLTQHAHQAPDQKTSHHGAAAYLDALGIKTDAASTTVHDQPADMDIVLAQVDQQDAVTHDQAHLDMSDALEHHDANVNHNQDDEHHHHNDVDGLPDIVPNP
ncbi:VCBS repeat-containing protein [Vibrio crassostreae]|uniref:VCBS domain-containing protein n=1 Tax=Vibrio crassostreae TaxID=246167 RepID=UPI00104FABC8|nr:VCBS domain-containing protein [Vibrio crassostreae]TCN83457.1 VCBS repeat-containing protein [Vibrio crassostreae]CAK2422820.1 VCBS repeat-containing protein [Vibrio crassostreae]CAK3808406.1 VCBS repeat-containing protein [Vibrio crassostreae]